MKVILLKDVAKIGRKFDVVQVPDGFALNKLIPKSMAQHATPENMSRLKSLSSKLDQDREQAAAAFAEVLSVIKDIEIPVEVEANAEGRMFQALKIEAIIEAIKNAIDRVVTSEQVLVKDPIKTLGEHSITLISGEKEGTVTLNLIAKTK